MHLFINKDKCCGILPRKIETSLNTLYIFEYMMNIAEYIFNNTNCIDSVPSTLALFQIQLLNNVFLPTLIEPFVKCLWLNSILALESSQL